MMHEDEKSFVAKNDKKSLSVFVLKMQSTC